jgi:hypothetical protein
MLHFAVIVSILTQRGRCLVTHRTYKEKHLRTAKSVAPTALVVTNSLRVGQHIGKTDLSEDADSWDAPMAGKKAGKTTAKRAKSQILDISQ